MATFVLVHGAFHGGWCWRHVTARLRALGHEVFAPTLTGLGERRHLASPAVDLSTHVRDVAGLIEWEELGDVALVGHSYGGMVITGVAERLADRLATLVYLDALVPENGQCALDLQLPERRESILEEVAANGGWRWPPRPAGFYGVRDPAKQAWVDGKCTPQPFHTLFERLRLDGPPGAMISRKLYIRCIDPPLAYMRRFYEWAAGVPGWASHGAGDGPRRHGHGARSPRADSCGLGRGLAYRSISSHEPAAPPSQPKGTVGGRLGGGVGCAAGPPKGKLVQFAHGHR